MSTRYNDQALNPSPAVTGPAAKGFADYYTFYLSQHQTKSCRRLHLLGLMVAVGVFIGLILSPYWWLAWLAPLTAYPFAWVGHFFFEHNIPATFRNPLCAALSDLVMAWDVARGRLPL